MMAGEREDDPPNSRETSSSSGIPTGAGIFASGGAGLPGEGDAGGRTRRRASGAKWSLEEEKGVRHAGAHLRRTSGL
jgi:hypothetical protein